MGMRRIFRRQPYPHPILRPTLPTPIPNRRPYPNPPYLPPRIWLKQPTRNRFKLRQNPIPSILLPKRHPRLHANTTPINNPSPIFPQPTWRPRKLYPSKPPKHTTTYQARMIFPICICHPTLNPKQTRRSSSPSRLRINPIPNSLPTQI
uniref:Uncharacterized protein n=1 Tax=Accipiter nisus TaxID=211598 RepID=A0A8B9MNF6_9AVES